MKNEILNILNEELKGFYFEVEEGTNFFQKNKYFKINIATSNYQINNVKGQYYNNISLCLEDDLELYFQVFGGNGGQRFYIKPDPNDPKQKYLALQGVKIPFRKPKKDKKAVLNAFTKVCKNYKSLLIEAMQNGFLRSENLEHTKQLLKN